MRAIIFAVATTAFGCASVPAPAVVHEAPRPPLRAEAPAWEAPKTTKAREPKRVEVHGIEGTMHSFDIRITMERKAADFEQCHAPRARRLPVLAGHIEFGIRVGHDGDVQHVLVRASDVGDRALERCFADVIAATQFPRPNGGDANITWTMDLGPVRKGREPEKWSAGRVERLISKNSQDVSERCEIPHGEAFDVTAYVNRRGRVVMAGVAARDASEPEKFDCIAEQLSRWSMPKPAKKPYAKVSFALMGTRT